eukprot:6128866-Prymnesium_polylepis.1
MAPVAAPAPTLAPAAAHVHVHVHVHVPRPVCDCARRTLALSLEGASTSSSFKLLHAFSVERGMLAYVSVSGFMWCACTVLAVENVVAARVRTLRARRA